MKSIVIEPASIEDWPRIMRLLDSVELPHSDLDAGAVDDFLVAKDAEVLMGAVAIEPYGSSGLLRSLAVHPQQQSAGLGRRLVQAALNQAKGRRHKAVYLLTTTAESFFRHVGFSVVSRNEVPPEVTRSSQFQTLCPSTAICLYKRLSV